MTIDYSRYQSDMQYKDAIDAEFAAVNATAGQQRAAQRRAHQAEEAAKNAATQQALIDAFQKESRSAFPGSDQEFIAAWPAILRQAQIRAALEGPRAVLDAKRRSGDYGM